MRCQNTFMCIFTLKNKNRQMVLVIVHFTCRCQNLGEKITITINSRWRLQMLTKESWPLNLGNQLTYTCDLRFVNSFDGSQHLVQTNMGDTEDTEISSSLDPPMDQIPSIKILYFFHNLLCLYVLDWLVVPIAKYNWIDRLVYQFNKYLKEMFCSGCYRKR